MKKPLSLIISLLLSGSVGATDLVDIYRDVESSNPTLLAAEAQRDASYEQVNSVKSVLLPQLSIAANYTSISSSVDQRDANVTSGIASVSQELFNRSSWINLTIAEKQARLADFKALNIKQNIILSTATTYFNVLKAQEKIKLAKLEAKAVKERLEQIKEQKAVGLTANTEVEETQAQYDSVVVNVIVAENELADALAQIHELTGQFYSDLKPLNISEFKPDYSAEDVSDLFDQANQNNAEIAQAKLTADIAKEATSAAKSGHLPTVKLKGEYQYTKDIDELNLGVTVALPLYTGGNISSKVKEASFNQVAAKNDLKRQQRALMTSIRNSDNKIKAIVKTISAYKQLVVSSKSSLEAIRAGENVGTRTNIDVLNANSKMYDAERQLSGAKYDYIVLKLSLEKEMGLLDEDDIKSANTYLIN